MTKAKLIKEAPPNLYLRLVTIQNFPGGQKVALYFCEQLKKYFSINYGKTGIEIMESDFSIISKLKTIDEVERLNFHDGSALNIDKNCCTSVIELYEDITEGREEFEYYISQSDKNFLSILDYSVNKFKKEN